MRLPQKSFLKVILLSFILSGFTSVLTVLPTRSESEQKSDDLSAPSHTRAKGSLGDSCGIENPEDVVAINPVATVNPHPTLWFYLPMNSGEIREMEIAILKGMDAVYDQEISGEKLANLPGFISIDLPPEDQNKLDKGIAYQLLIYCGDSESSQLRIPKIPTQLQTPSPELQTQLEQATSELEQAKIYNQNNMWYDALTILGRLRRQTPDNPEYKQEWEQILKKIKLAELADKPIGNHIQ
ncbi:MAG: DUF928 domain-containing protein [Cyanobacteria bacterium J06592_8]